MFWLIVKTWSSFRFRFRCYEYLFGKNWQFGHHYIALAYQRIRPYLVNTPIIQPKTFSELCQCEVLSKLENLQMRGSCKERGALNKLLSLTEAERQLCVVAASAGNQAAVITLGRNYPPRLSIGLTLD